MCVGGGGGVKNVSDSVSTVLIVNALQFSLKILLTAAATATLHGYYNP